MKGEKESRFRLFYSKQGPAKYVSHIDLSQTIQRSLRRAGIQVRHTQGFHPKMHLSFPPALGLGMKGKEEVLEFHSRYQLSGQQTIERINRYFPEGIRVLKIERIDSRRPSLSKDIKSVVYSLDLNQEGVRTAVKKKAHLKRMNLSAAFEFIEKAVNQENLSDLRRIYLETKKKKVMFEFSFSPSRALKLKPVINKVLGIEYPNFVLTREKFTFQSTEPPP
jgi:radical SAM-linked protein